MSKIEEKNEKSLSKILATVGAVLIFVGIAWIIALNWHIFPAPVKILILVLATVVAYTSGVMLRIHDYPGIGETLIILGALLYTLSIFLIEENIAKVRQIDVLRNIPQHAIQAASAVLGISAAPAGSPVL